MLLKGALKMGKNFNELALEMHRKYQGKVGVVCKVPLETRDDLSTAYETPEAVYDYTAKGRMIAVVSDGSAVLGLGNIGAQAAMPVMEGKAVLFKKFGDVDAVPICLDTQDTEEIIRTVKNIAPCFGGINLEDISSPRCFEIERRLEEELPIPVFHDDQHGTGIVVTAALLNALKVVGKKLEDVKIVLNGPGAAGTAIIKMMLAAGAKNIIACDENGILYRERGVGIADHKEMLCDITNPEGLRGTLADALQGADVFVGVSVGGALKPEMIRTMAKDPIVFAMANPTPEIMYDEAVAAGVRVMGTGRSDFPNQINNVLAFPGIFKGASPEELNEEYIIPSIFDQRVTEAVAAAVEAASKQG